MTATDIEDDLDTDLGDDLVWHVAGIAREINRPTRVVSHMLENGQLPAGKIGNRWVSSKRRLRKRLAEVIAGADEAT